MENKSQGDVGQTASIYLATHVKLELCSPTSLWGTTNRMVCLQPSRASHVPWVQWIPEFVVRPLRTRCACHRFKIGLHYDYHLICHLLLALFFLLNIYNGYSKNLRKSAMFLLESVASPFSTMDSIVPSCFKR